MFDLIRGKIFEKKVVDKIQLELISLLGKERGEASFGLFAIAITKAQDHDHMPRDMIRRLRKSGLNVNDAAISYLDASVTACKRTRNKGGNFSADLDAIVADMERGIDHMFLANPSVKILPRNGHVGDSMSEFASEKNLW